MIVSLQRVKQSFTRSSPAATDSIRQLRPKQTTQVRHPNGRGPDDGFSERYRWSALAIIVIGTFMVVLDSTIVGVALDPIGRSLHSAADVEWIITAYLLTLGVIQSPIGWLADRIGRKPVFIGSMVIFAVGSLCSAFAPTMEILILCRVVQGIGGGAVFPVGTAIIYELFPPDRRGAALGIRGIGLMAAPAAGPVLGGWLVTAFSWRWMFLINVPIGIIGAIIAIRVLRNTGFQERRPFDWVGTTLVGVGVLGLLLALSEGAGWGWTSGRTLGCGIGGVALLAIFAWWVLRKTRTPVVDLRMFKITIYSLAIGVTCLLTLAQYGRVVFIPLELESLRHLTALHTGVLLVPGAIGAAISMPFGGRLADRIGAKLPVVVGLIPVAIANWYLGHLTVNSSQDWLMFFLFLAGLGTGLAMTPNAVVGLNALPAPLIATGSALRSLTRQIAAAVAIAILTAVVASQLGGGITFHGVATPAHAQAAYNASIIWGFWAVILTMIIAMFLPGRARAKELQQARIDEQRSGKPLSATNALTDD